MKGSVLDSIGVTTSFMVSNATSASTPNLGVASITTAITASVTTTTALTSVSPSFTTSSTPFSTTSTSTTATTTTTVSFSFVTLMTNNTLYKQVIITTYMFSVGVVSLNGAITHAVLVSPSGIYFYDIDWNNQISNISYTEYCLKLFT